jgi:hypothetical protein
MMVAVWIYPGRQRASFLPHPMMTTVRIEAQVIMAAAGLLPPPPMVVAAVGLLPPRLMVVVAAGLLPPPSDDGGSTD